MNDDVLIIGYRVVAIVCGIIIGLYYTNCLHVLFRQHVYTYRSLGALKHLVFLNSEIARLKRENEETKNMLTSKVLKEATK